MAFWGSFFRGGHFTNEIPSMPKKPRTPSSKVWTNCSQNVGFHFPMCLQQCSPADASLKCMAVPQRSCTNWVRRRWPPLGGVQWNPERARPKSFHPSVPASNLYASKLSLRFLAHGPTPILIFPSPGPARTAALRPQFALEASKCDFFAFQKSS